MKNVLLISVFTLGMLNFISCENDTQEELSELESLEKISIDKDEIEKIDT